MPCCEFKFCTDCSWKNKGCLHCHNHLDVDLIEKLPVYKPTNVLLEENIVPCRFCGNQYTRLLLHKHEDECISAPVSDLVVDMMQLEKPANGKLTLKELRSIQIRKNLVNSFMLNGSISLSTRETASANYKTHVIQDIDTLPGLAIRYGCSVADIRRLNHLVGQSIHERSVIKVPANGPPDSSTDPAQMTQSMEELMKKRLAIRFVKENIPCEYSEAMYYLEAADYNYEQAQKEFKEDASWARTNKPLLPMPQTREPARKVDPVVKATKMKRRGCILCVS